jgi:hypothetical protein
MSGDQSDGCVRVPRRVERGVGIAREQTRAGRRRRLGRHEKICNSVVVREQGVQLIRHMVGCNNP